MIGIANWEAGDDEAEGNNTGSAIDNDNPRGGEDY
jgi:hypothetical protein